MTRIAALYAVCNLAQKAIGFLAMLWMAAILSTSDYAAFGRYYATYALLAGLAGAGIVEALMALLGDESAEFRATLARAGRLVFAVQSFLLLIALIVLAASSSDVSGGGTLSNAILVATSGVATAYAAHLAGENRIQQNYKYAMLYALLPGLAGWVAGATLYLMISGVGSLFSGIAVGSTAATLAMRACAGEGATPNAKALMSLAKQIGMRTWPYFCMALMVWVTGYGMTFGVSVIFADAEVARYTLLFSLASLVQLIAASISQAWGPRFMRIRHVLSPQQLLVAERKFAVLTAAGVLAGAGSLFIALSSFSRLLPERVSVYAAREQDLLLLTLAYAALIPWYQATHHFYCRGEGRLLLYVSLGVFPFAVMLWIYLMTTLGSTGIYYGFAAASAVKSLVAAFVVYRRWGVRLDALGPLIGVLGIGIMIWIAILGE